MNEIDALRKQVDSVFAATKATREEMRRHRALFAGDLWNLKETDFDSWEKSTIQFNILFSTIEAIAPLITDNRPITRVSPRYPFLQKLGETLNNITKYAWGALDMQTKIHRWVMDAKICKYGVVKLCYNPEKRWGGKYDLTVIDPIDFFIAPGYDDVWEAPWCGVRAKKPMSWVKAHFPDAKLKASKLQEGSKDQRSFKYSGASVGEADVDFIEVTEMWLRDDEAMETVTEEDPETGKKTKRQKQKFPYGKFVWFTDKEKLGEEASTDDHGLPPYVVLYNYIRPHDFVGISDVELIEGIHKDLNLTLKYYSDFVRRYHNQNELVDITAGFDVATYKRERTKGGQVFTWDSRGGSLESPVQPIEEPQLHANLREYFGFLPMMSEEVSGVTDITKGQVGKQERQSASELAILNETSNTRVRQQIRNLEGSLTRVYYLFLCLVRQYQTEPEYFSWHETEGTAYTEYGNSFAQADRIMRPVESPEMEDLVRRDAERPSNDPETRKAIREYKQEIEDYKQFLELFKENGEFDPVFFDFDIEIQTDSMLPKDKQSRANLMMRLLQMSPQPAQLAMFELVLEYLQVPNYSKVVQEMREMAQKMMQAKSGGPQPTPAPQEVVNG